MNIQLRNLKFLFPLCSLLNVSAILAQPSNDLCSGAISLTEGNGTCSSPAYTNVGATTSAGDPTPACWVPASISNNVWFSFVATSPSVDISTNFGYSLTNTQIAVYSGTCGALVQIACQEDINTGAGLLQTNVLINGLTIGNTYYIMVDGNGNQTGTFGICVQSSLPPGPPSPNQDCPTGQFLCNKNAISIADGPGNIGTIQEAPSCFGAPGERSSHWYRFTIKTTGTLCFSLVPKNNSSTDYDFAVFDITAGCLGTELACNWAPPPLGCGNAACATTGLGCANASLCPACLTVTAGKTYAILLDRYTAASSDGYDLTFGGTCVFDSPIPNFAATTVCLGNPTQFTDFTGGSNLYNWDFGNGVTSGLANPSITYAAPGVYSVSMLVTSNPGGCQNLLVKNVTVNNIPTVSISPLNPYVCPSSSASVTLTAAGTTTSTYTGAVPFSSGTINMAITNNSPAPGVNSIIPVQGISPDATSQLSSVCFDITEPRDQDLVMKLTSPGGSSILLYNKTGTGANMTNTCFVPAGAANTGSVTTGNITTNQSFALLGGVANGNWNINVTDQGAGGTPITLKDWNMTFNTVANGIVNYQWVNNTTGLSATNQPSPVASPTATTTYTVIVTDALGCTNQQTTVVDYCFMLPINILNFDAYKDSKSVRLKWTTAQETNNQYFQIERSLDGSTFTAIGRKQGAGNSSTLQSYTFTDDNPVNTLSFYRLKQVGFDGKFSYSNLALISGRSNTYGFIDVHPNPLPNGTAILGIGYNASEAGNATISIRNLIGQEIFRKEFPLNEGDNNLNISLEELNLTTSMYFVQVQTTNGIETKRLMIDKK